MRPDGQTLKNQMKTIFQFWGYSTFKSTRNFLFKSAALLQVHFLYAKPKPKSHATIQCLLNFNLIQLSTSFRTNTKLYLPVIVSKSGIRLEFVCKLLAEPYFCCSFAQASFSVTVRLNTIFSAVESGSAQK